MISGMVVKDRTHDATLRAILGAIALGRVDSSCNVTCNIACNIDGVPTKLCKQGNLIG